MDVDGISVKATYTFESDNTVSVLLEFKELADAPAIPSIGTYSLEKNNQVTVSFNNKLSTSKLDNKTLTLTDSDNAQTLILEKKK